MGRYRGTEMKGWICCTFRLYLGKNDLRLGCPYFILGLMLLFPSRLLSFLVTGRALSSDIFIYNSEVWHLQIINQALKNALMSISAKAIRICTKRADTCMLSFINLHEMAGRATPNKIMSYKLALQLYRTFNDQTPMQDWLKTIKVQYQQILQTKSGHV